MDLNVDKNVSPIGPAPALRRPHVKCSLVGPILHWAYLTVATTAVFQTGAEGYELLFEFPTMPRNLSNAIAGNLK